MATKHDCGHSKHYPHQVDLVATLSTLGSLSLGIVFEREQVHFEAVGSLLQRTARYVVGIALLAVVFFGLDVIINASGQELAYLKS